MFDISLFNPPFLLFVVVDLPVKKSHSKNLKSSEGEDVLCTRTLHCTALKWFDPLCERAESFKCHHSHQIHTEFYPVCFLKKYARKCTSLLFKILDWTLRKVKNVGKFHLVRSLSVVFDPGICFKARNSSQMLCC